MIDFAKLPASQLIEDPGLRERAELQIANSYTRHYLIRENGKELAFLSLDFYPHPDPLFIYEMFVSSGVRCQGVGTRLLREIEMPARKEWLYQHRTQRPSLGRQTKGCVNRLVREARV